MEKYLTIEETANLFKVTRVTIDNWMKKGKIKIIRIDGTVRIPADQFAEMEKTEEEK